MTPVRRQVYLLVCGVAAFVIALCVFIGNKNWESDALAGGLVFGGIAMIVIALPVKNGNGNGGKR